MSKRWYFWSKKTGKRYFARHSQLMRYYRHGSGLYSKNGTFNPYRRQYSHGRV